MNVCPVCNGLIDYIKYCPRCNKKMGILDRVENYYDDYSPYLDYKLTDLNDGDPRDVCTHICYCPECDVRQTVGIRSIAE